MHHEVILGLLDAALEDNRISKAERAEIERAATWLSVDVSEWDTLTKAGRKRVKQRRAEFTASVKGKVVVFTGQGVHPHNVREALALKHGMTPKKTLGAKADLVVIGSEELDTATVQKARAAEIPLMVESTFWQRLGEL